ncbi:hypothetical protein ILUMI_17038, partial [Ignelater luminosus]
SMTYIHKQWKPPVQKFEKECMLETGLEQYVLNEFYESPDIPDNYHFKCQLKCYGMKLGILSSTGDINVEKWVDLFDYMNVALAEKCVQMVKEEDLCEKSYLLVKCVNDELSKQYPS